MKSFKCVWITRFGIALGLSLNAYASPIDLSTLIRLGTTELKSSTILRLTPNFETNPGAEPPPAGAAWTPSRVNVLEPFVASFAFRMSGATGQPDPGDGGGGDGITFLIQNDLRGTSAIGRGAGGMGFLGIYNSVAVMFDPYQNNYAYGDPSGNYVGVNTRGQDFNVPHHFCTSGQLTTDPSLPPDLPGVTCTGNPSLGMQVLSAPRLDDGALHRALVTYSGGFLTVTLDSVPVLSVPLDLSKTLALENSSNAYIGFTAGTRFSYQNHDIEDFAFTTIPEPSTGISLIGGLAFVVLRFRRRGCARRDD